MAVMKWVKNGLLWLKEALLELLFPDGVRCLCCSEALGEDAQEGVCPACRKALDRLEIGHHRPKGDEPLPEGIDYVLAAYPYTGQVKRLIWRLKFECVRAAAVPLARAMATLPGGEEELLVPVPTTRRRLRQRGFNHAQVLCRHIADELGMPMADALTRTDDSIAQSRLRGQSRRQNLAGTMVASDAVCGKRVLLIDDVYTTGATAGEAARALLEAGAVSVGVFAAAHSLYGKAASNGVKSA